MPDGDQSSLALLPAVKPGEFPLALYDAMCRAIDLAHRVDEVKDIRDKALAFEVYTRQAQNIDAERYAVAVRLRAERKAGQLLKKMDKAKGAAGQGRPPKGGSTAAPPKDQPTLRDLGMTKKQSSQWQKLGEVTEELFEEALADKTTKPSTAGIIKAAAEPEPEQIAVSTEALWLWGRLKDFERDGLLTKDTADVLLTMTAPMLDDTHRLAPLVAAWLRSIGEPK